MNYVKSLIICLICMTLSSTHAMAETCAKDDMSKAIDYAVKLLNTKGKAALTELQAYRYCGAEGYVFVLDMNGTVLLQPMAVSLVGKDITVMQGAMGEYFGAEIKAKALKDGHGWVSYTWKNPATNKIAVKCSYIKTATMDGKKVIVGSGIYDVKAEDCR